MDEGREGVIHPGGGASEKERCGGRGREKGRGRKTDRKTERERDPTRFAFPRRGPNSSRRLDQCQDECWINLRRNYLLRRSLSALITSPNDQS